MVLSLEMNIKIAREHLVRLAERQDPAAIATKFVDVPAVIIGKIACFRVLKTFVVSRAERA
jgi:hypothetical protein